MSENDNARRDSKKQPVQKTGCFGWIIAIILVILNFATCGLFS